MAEVDRAVVASPLVAGWRSLSHGIITAEVDNLYSATPGPDVINLSNRNRTPPPMNPTVRANADESPASR